MSDPITLPGPLYDALQIVAEMSGGVACGRVGTFIPSEPGDPGCLLGMAAWLDGGKENPDARLSLALAFRAAGRPFVHEVNNRAFRASERDDRIPFEMLCERANIVRGDDS